MTLPRIDIDQSERAIRESLRDAEVTPLIITKHGKPYAALVPLPGVDVETATLSLSAQFLSLIERSRRRLEEEGGVEDAAMEERFA